MRDVFDIAPKAQLNSKNETLQTKPQKGLDVATLQLEADKGPAPASSRNEQQKNQDTEKPDEFEIKRKLFFGE